MAAGECREPTAATRDGDTGVRKEGNLHVSGLVSHDEGRGEAVLVVEGAAPHRVAHPRDRSVT